MPSTEALALGEHAYRRRARRREGLGDDCRRRPRTIEHRPRICEAQNSDILKLNLGPSTCAKHTHRGVAKQIPLRTRDERPHQSPERER